jgi:hypothetical protein
MGRLLARMGRRRTHVTGGKAGRKELLGRPRRRWMDNIRMDLGEIGWSGVDWICLAQDCD